MVDAHSGVGAVPRLSDPLVRSFVLKRVYPVLRV
jgi:hypothetical protein